MKESKGEWKEGGGRLGLCGGRARRPKKSGGPATGASRREGLGQYMQYMRDIMVALRQYRRGGMIPGRQYILPIPPCVPPFPPTPTYLVVQSRAWRVDEEDAHARVAPLECNRHAGERTARSGTRDEGVDAAGGLAPDLLAGFKVGPARGREARSRGVGRERAGPWQ